MAYILLEDFLKIQKNNADKKVRNSEIDVPKNFC